MAGGTNRGRPLPWAMRQRLEQLVSAGMPVRQAVRELRISPTTAYKYLRASLDTIRSKKNSVRVESIA